MMLAAALSTSAAEDANWLDVVAAVIGTVTDRDRAVASLLASSARARSTASR
jgi:hypothetical protein